MLSRLVLFLALAGLALPIGAHAAAVLDDVDARTGEVAPTAAQLDAVERLDATARWNRFGSPSSLLRPGDFLATGLAGEPEEVARAFLAANADVLGLTATQVGSLRLLSDVPLADGAGNAILLRQRFGELDAAEGGFVTVGVKGDKVAFVSSSATRADALAAQPSLSPVEAWLRAAANVGRGISILETREPKPDGEWSVFSAKGFTEAQRARLVAVPTYTAGVRPAYETLVLDSKGGDVTGFHTFVDAATGEIVVRKDIVEQSHQPVSAFTGSVPQTDAACGSKHALGTVGEDERVGSVALSVEATLTTNDSVINLYRDGAVVATQDTLFSPEALVYDPPDSGQGAYEAEVCDFVDGFAWDTPATYTGQAVFSPVGTALPYPPKWKVFPANPLLGADSYPYDFPSTDSREVWCWESSVGTPPTALPECDREVQNLAARVPWDFHPRTDAPTFTTSGNNAHSAEAWTNPVAPGATAFRPTSTEREYVYPWQNVWHTSGCNTPFVPGQSHDVSAAVTNLFAMHNRMHDWSYHLGFTERAFNAQDSNFGTGGTAENDALQGDAQAGALDGGFPTYTGRDNANMRPLPDGVPAITNMYLWQPLAGALYPPCVDGDFDMSIIGHEYTHLIENRMIGKGGTRGGHHAGAMGESFSDLTAVEILNEYGFVPVSGENPYAVGAYATGHKQRGIRNYGMKTSPLNFSDHGYDHTGAQVHADGEIWSATNFDIRQAFVEKYGAGDSATQIACAEGKRPADQCPGNRRWIQIIFDAYLLMPVAPSMLDARDAYLAADVMRFGGANQTELWRAFAGRGFGEGAFSTNAVSNDNDTDPKPDFTSPLAGETEVTFEAVAADEDGAPITGARVYVGDYEARVSPIADTNPATSAPDPGANNLDATAGFVAGTYDFVVNAPGYGHVRFEKTFSGEGAETVTISMPTNRASASKGAVAAGDGANHRDLIDDTEATNWDRTAAVPDVRGSLVTVDLQGGVQTVDRVQVSAMLLGQNRFTALRQFEIRTCNAAVANCIAPDVGFGTIFTSPEDAFPGVNPRPAGPDLILREFDVPDTQATHVQIRVLTNQCTGQPTFQGEQDFDPVNTTDCRDGGNAAVATVFGDLPQLLVQRDDEVHIAELQVFSGEGGLITPQADLVVTDLALAGNGARRTITATVANEGTADAGASQTRFALGSTELCVRDTPAIAAGGSVEVTCNAVLKKGDRVIAATADSGGTATESNETNNTRTETFAVG